MSFFYNVVLWLDASMHRRRVVGFFGLWRCGLAWNSRMAMPWFQCEAHDSRCIGDRLPLCEDSLWGVVEVPAKALLVILLVLTMVTSPGAVSLFGGVVMALHNPVSTGFQVKILP